MECKNCKYWELVPCSDGSRVRECTWGIYPWGNEKLPCEAEYENQLLNAELDWRQSGE